MEVSRQEYDVIQNTLEQWGKDGTLTTDEVQRLKADLTIHESQRQQVAQYFFIIALSCTLLAFGAIFIDEKLLEQVKRYFSLGNITIAAATALLTTAWFWYLWTRRSKLSQAAYEVYHVFAALGVVTTLIYLLRSLATGNSSYSTLFVISSAVLFLLSISFHSRALWVCALLALLAWYGNFSAEHSNRYLFLGMNYPMRFTALGLLLLCIAFVQSKITRLRFSERTTYVIGIFLFFIALWSVSIFGNINYLSEWVKVRQVHVIGYSVIFAIAAVLSFTAGIRYKDDVARDIGILFLLLNLYTRYFEFFWDSMNKGIFFLIMAVTFGILGHQLQRKRQQTKKNDVS